MIHILYYIFASYISGFAFGGKTNGVGSKRSNYRIYLMDMAWDMAAERWRMKNDQASPSFGGKFLYAKLNFHEKSP